MVGRNGRVHVSIRTISHYVPFCKSSPVILLLFTIIRLKLISIYLLCSHDDSRMIFIKHMECM